MRTEYHNLNNREISIPIAESYKDCIRLIKSDQYRLTGKINSTISIFLKILKPFNNSSIFWLRMSSYKGFLYRFCNFMYNRASRKAKIDIPPPNNKDWLWILHRAWYLHRCKRRNNNWQQCKFIAISQYWDKSINSSYNW